MTGEGYKPLTDESVAAITSSCFAQRAARSSAQDHPRVVLVGGQPGAGKSAGGELVRDELKAQGGFVHVDADRMRERIPLGTARLPSSETQADAGRLANALRLMAIEARRNIVEEGTFRNPQSVQRFVDRLQEQGYKVEMVVVATSREESLLGIYQRHERQHQVGNPNPRFVTEDYHDAAMQGFSATVSQLAHQLDRLRIINRGGQLLYDSQRQPRDDATMALQAAREIPAERRTMLADGWAAVAAAARERGANPQYLDAIGGHARRVAASAQLQGDRGARITPYTRGKEQALSRGASPAGPFTSLAATPQASKPPARSR